MPPDLFQNGSAAGVVADHSSDKNGDKGADKVDKNDDKKELSVETKKKARVHRKRKHAAANGFNDNNNWHGGGKRRIGGLDVDDERLRAYGVNPKKFKNRIFHKNKRGALGGGANSSS